MLCLLLPVPINGRPGGLIQVPPLPRGGGHRGAAKPHGCALQGRSRRRNGRLPAPRHHGLCRAELDAAGSPQLHCCPQRAAGRAGSTGRSGLLCFGSLISAAPLMRVVLPSSTPRDQKPVLAPATVGRGRFQLGLCPDAGGRPVGAPMHRSPRGRCFHEQPVGRANPALRPSACLRLWQGAPADADRCPGPQGAAPQRLPPSLPSSQQQQNKQKLPAGRKRVCGDPAPW